jgi:hypothetical protein
VQIYGLSKYEPPAPGTEEWDPEDWIAEHGLPPQAPPQDPAGPAAEVDRPAPDTLSPIVLAGSFTHPRPWATDIEDLEARAAGDGIWELDLRFEQTPGIAFKLLNTHTGQAFGGISSAGLPLDAVAVEDGPPAEIRAILNGDYRLTFNENTLRLRFEQKHLSTHQRLHAVGNFNNWSRVADPMHMTDDHRWQAVLDPDPGAPLEFIIVADGSLETQWGGDAHTSLPAQGSATFLGRPFRIENPPPRLIIEFDEASGTYSLRSAPQ